MTVGVGRLLARNVAARGVAGEAVGEVAAESATRALTGGNPLDPQALATDLLSGGAARAVGGDLGGAPRHGDAGQARFIVGSDGAVDDVLDGSAPNAVSIGRFPAYVELAQQTGARTFAIALDDWTAMSPVEQHVRNMRYLDREIERGAEIWLASPLGEAEPGSGYLAELEHLRKRGYGLNEDGTKFVREEF